MFFAFVCHIIKSEFLTVYGIEWPSTDRDLYVRINQYITPIECEILGNHRLTKYTGEVSSLPPHLRGEMQTINYRLPNPETDSRQSRDLIQHRILFSK